MQMALNQRKRELNVKNENRARATRTISFLLFLAASCQAFAESHPDVEAAFFKYAEASKIFDTQQMTNAMHPEALGRFRKTIDAALNGPKKDQAATELLPLFSANSVDEYSKMSDVEVYKRLNDTIAKSAPELLELMSQATYEIVSTSLKDDLAYVNYNLTMKIEEKEIKQLVVQTLKKHEGNWLLMLPSTAEASIAGIEKRFN